MRKAVPTTAAPALLDHADAGPHRAAGGEQIVHQQDAVPFEQGVDVHFERVLAVFQLVMERMRVKGELARFADGDEACLEREGERSRENEPAGLGGDDAR